MRLEACSPTTDRHAELSEAAGHLGHILELGLEH